MRLEIVTKMDNYIYVHHNGQFLHMNPPPKIQTAIGDKGFVNVQQELVYSLENSRQNCSNMFNDGLDRCIIEVSNSEFRFHVHMKNSNSCHPFF